MTTALVSANSAPTAASVQATTAPSASVPTSTESQTTPPVTAPAAGPVPEAVSLTEEFDRFKAAYEAKKYPEASIHAGRVLEMTEKQAATPEDEEVQVALMNLALMQALAGDHVAAEASYLRAIDLVEKSGRLLNARLARAYGGLASAYHDGNRHDLAVTSFEQAISLTRRHEGLLSEQQVPLIEKYVDSLTRLGRYEDALQAQRYMLRIAQRRAGGDGDPRVAPAMERLGRWYASVGAYEQARRTLKQTIVLVENAEGSQSPRLINPLLALADCDRRQLFDPTQNVFATLDPERAAIFHEPTAVPLAYSPLIIATEGEKALLRAAALADARVDPSMMQIADVRTQLGDWYQARVQPERALPHYLLAWQAAAKVADPVAGQPMTTALFGKPILLHILQPDSWDKFRERPAEQVELRTVTIEFTVNARGMTQDPKVTDDSGDKKRTDKTLDALKTARYRPRFENGQPVATAGIVYSQPWILLLEPAPGEGESPPGERRSERKEAKPPPSS
jgi:tetratricopeptide (TPR) repeat protein